MKKTNIIEGENVYQYKNCTYLPGPCQLSNESRRNYLAHVSTRYINVVSNIEKKLPELYTEKKECLGCFACYNACPLSGDEYSLKDESTYFKISTIGNVGEYSLHKHTGAISMLPDEEGFLYPVVDSSICVRCYTCILSCPLNNGFK